MTSPRVHISAPSRLHFGLFSFGHTDQRRQYGGVGVALASPRCELEFVGDTPDGLRTSGPDSERVAEFAQRWAARHRAEVDCDITVHRVIPSHIGLGSGTQLALTVAKGLHYVTGSPDGTVKELAESVQRGLRSAVGTYAFAHGGMIVEKGKRSDQSLAPLDQRVRFPETWRFVLFRPPKQTGLSGAPESDAFCNLPPVPTEITKRLEALANEQLVPAAENADFETFSTSLYQYGITAGSCFKSCQTGGAFASPAIQSMVALLRDWGISGVGQSSWGPTVFALVRSGADAQQLVHRVSHEGPGDFKHWQAQVSAIDNHGAIVRATSSPESMTNPSAASSSPDN